MGNFIKERCGHNVDVMGYSLEIYQFTIDSIIWEIWRVSEILLLRLLVFMGVLSSLTPIPMSVRLATQAKCSKRLDDLSKYDLGVLQLHKCTKKYVSVCTDVYMYTHMYIDICTYISIYFFNTLTYIYIYICVWLCMYIYIYTYTA